MKFKVDDKEYPCCTSLTMKYIGGKWKTVILIHLKTQPHRYNELKKIISTISERTLSLQLKQLEEDGLINRKVLATDKPPLKVEYSLTDFGKTLIPLLDAISSWGEQAASLDDKVEVIG
ncbi:helix-turn-helix transcriptional regulator [Flammeovirga yaeyamensis]|uniref:Helix-turn-helix transcriptional regulator n=1 Tax=Flammeovirga yaeyamensis TaxID=367791 RepID=A0AAX1N3L4_9BACT|nr:MULTISPECIES: helix-turn-helix domain-containing protein [Flammeovirga]ANQ50677.1 helix-turn-helix transcriptional regulator [Flammeovirga sp. MY04]MBB3701027.1 DNA-binding HxlR family transcriptional regulator [Flammeovirga yaeyamensis]NMF38140.1 helix-turn-helix transcriptional regulator [Flammeovirga yaeyamensis]QWG01911.1 helix-turn-helix transcriptional regulator [Flammeovirga yaeyamensis]